MTPTEQDKELEKAIQEALQIDIMVSIENSGLKLKSAVIDLEAVMQLIKQHREAYALEARVDEVKMFRVAMTDAHMTPAIYEPRRIAELKAELREKVGK